MCRVRRILRYRCDRGARGLVNHSVHDWCGLHRLHRRLDRDARRTLHASDAGPGRTAAGDESVADRSPPSHTQPEPTPTQVREKFADGCARGTCAIALAILILTRGFRIAVSCFSALNRAMQNIVCGDAEIFYDVAGSGAPVFL